MAEAEDGPNARIRSRCKEASRLQSMLGKGPQLQYLEEADELEAMERAAEEEEQASQAAMLKENDPEAEQPLERKLCTDCGSASYSTTFLQAFGRIICNACKADRYPMVTKSTAKEEYLCTDSELAKLRFLERKNPRKPTWAPMKLFLQREVEAIAWAKHGDQEGLTQAKTTKEVKQLESRMSKTRKTAQKTRSPSKKARKEALASLKTHQHTFVDEPGAQRCTECGLRVEVEEF